MATLETPRAEQQADQSRYPWLIVGAVLSLFAVHGSWDITLAAWLFSIFLLRFVRVSRPVAGIGLVWLVHAVAAVYWMWQVAVPMNAVTVVGATALGSVLVVPYLLDRIGTPRLGPIAGLLLFPAAHAAAEWAIAVVSPFGSAYGLLAATQHSELPLLQVISVIGPYGIGFLISLLATVVNRVWENPLPWRRTGALIGGYGALLGIVLVGGGARLAFFPPNAETVRVAGISPGKSPTAGTAELFTRTRQAARSDAKIVIWSEQAADVQAADEPEFLADAASVARQERIYLQVAVDLHLPEAPFARNYVRMIDPQGSALWTYHKAHPIPGLENYPPGDGNVPVVQTPYGRLASVICFDADFPALAQVDADILFVPARDWPEIGAVHNEKAGLRAVENGYAMVRQAEFGMASAFDHQGRRLHAQDYSAGAAEHTMIVDVPVHGTSTVYRLAGDLFAWLCAAGTVVSTAVVLTGIGLARRRSRRA